MSSRKSSDFVQGQAAKSAVGFVQLWTVDLAGRLRGVTVTAAQLDQAFDDGVPMAARALGVRGRALDDALLLVPDAATWALLPRPDAASAGAPRDPRPLSVGPGPPGASVVARMFCDLLEPDGSPSVWDTRGALKRALGHASALGYTFYAGAALQHTYLTGLPGPPEPLDAGPDHGFGPSPERQELLHATVRALEQLGAVVGAITQGRGPAQQSLELAWTDALTLADTVVTHRRVTSDQARARGRAATFMPFPFGDAPGNGLALTLSLHDGDEPAFWDPNDAAGRSATAHQFAAGIERVGAALSLLARPTVNSYTQATAAPPFVVATPARGRGDEDAHLCFRAADPSANPYLLLAALLEAGLTGIEGGDPGRREATPVPVTLVEAAALAEGSPLLRRVLGAELLAALVSAARAEGVAYRQQVTPWELARYLDVT